MSIYKRLSAFHLFSKNSVAGWTVGMNTINVMKVTNTDYFKRSFRIFDRDYPYTLVINYCMSEGFIDRIHCITRRYKTVEECEKEIIEINNLQENCVMKYTN